MDAVKMLMILVPSGKTAHVSSISQGAGEGKYLTSRTSLNRSAEVSLGQAEPADHLAKPEVLPQAPIGRPSLNPGQVQASIAKSLFQRCKSGMVVAQTGI